MSSLHLYGNHRGGTEIVHRLPDRVAARYSPRWTLADPQADRAAQLAGLVERRFPWVTATPKSVPAQRALVLAEPEDTLVLALDTIGDTQAVLTARRLGQRAAFQIVGRGPGGHGGVRLGLAGMLVPGDEETAGRSSLLLNTLGQIAPPQSSRSLTETDPLSNVVLGPLRALATQATITNLAERERDPADLTTSPLQITMGREMLPLVPVPANAGERYRHRAAMALETASRLPLHHWVERGGTSRRAMVALVTIERASVELFAVSLSTTGRRRVEGLTALAPPAPELRARPAVFTD